MMRPGTCWLPHGVQVVGGSNPLAPTNHRFVLRVVRADRGIAPSST